MTRGSSRGSRWRLRTRQRCGARDRVPRGGAGRAISLCLGRAAGARGGRRGMRPSCARSSRSRPGDPVIAAGRHRGRDRAQGRAWPAGLRAWPRSASRTSSIDHETRTARLVLPVDPGPVARFGEIRVTGQPPFSAPPCRADRAVRDAATGSSSPMSTICAARWSRPGWSSTVEVKVTPVGAGRDGRSRRAAGAGADAHDRRRARLWHRRGAARRSELAAPQFLQSRRRADGARGRRHAGAIGRGVVPAEQFPAARPGAQRAGLGQQRRSRRLCGEDPAAVGRDRAAEQFHLAQEMDLEPRRRIARCPTSATRSNRPARNGGANFFIAALPASLGYDGSDDLLDPTRGFRLLGRISPELSCAERSVRLCPGAVRCFAPIIRCRTESSPPGGCGSGRSSARAAT